MTREIIQASLEGHRLGYSKYFMDNLSAVSLKMSLSVIFRRSTSSKTILMCFDEFYLLGFLYLISRFLTKRRILIVIKNADVIDRPLFFRHKVLKFLLNVSRSLNSNVVLCSMLPLSLLSQRGKFFDKYLPDPEFIDINILETNKDRVEEDFIAYIGLATERKGFSKFLEYCQNHKSIKFGFFGRIEDNSLLSLAANIEKNIGFLKASEIYRAFVRSTHIWVFYSGQGRISSGLIGRCYQLNKTAIVKSQSFQEEMCLYFKVDHISLNLNLDVVSSITFSRETRYQTELSKLFHDSI